ncbi:MAG: molybdenum ABC transporter ATP-binding protein [Alphaproteobacteria bacterium]|jgi:molybdate transport system ATP-binding protein
MSSKAGIQAAFLGKLGDFNIDLAFDAPMRGVTALFGPSGSGKTTALRCIAGLTKIGGALSVEGDIWQDSSTFVAPHKRRAGYVFQDANLFPHLTVTGNLHYGAKRAGPGGLNEDEVIDLLGLDRLLDRHPRALSGGERQRVAIGRVLLSHPRILLMDEPLSALDAMTKAEILPYLDRLTDAAAIPILYVSHDIGEVARLADCIVQVAGGRVVACGPVADMMEQLGLEAGVSAFEESVLLTGSVVSHDAAHRLTRLDCFGQRLTAPPVAVPIGKTVRIRVRARDVALATTRPTGISIRNILAATVIDIASSEDAANVEVTVDIGGPRLKARITREALSDLSLTPGAEVFALVKSVSFDGRGGS